MVPMIAKKSFVYAGKRLAVGSPFNARTSQDAKLLRAIGNAVDGEPAEVAPPPVAVAPNVGPYSRKVVEAPTTPVDLDVTYDAAGVVEDTPRPKRAYRRRDLQAE